MANEGKRVFIFSKDQAWISKLGIALTAIGDETLVVDSVLQVVELAKNYRGTVCVFIDDEGENIEALHLASQAASMVIPTVVVKSPSDSITELDSIDVYGNFVVSKSESNDVLAQLANQAFVTHRVLRHKMSVQQNYLRMTQLDEREREIVNLVVDGAPNKQIANKVGVSIKTIERVRKSAYEKLGVRSTAEMTRAVILGNLHDIVFIDQPVKNIVPAPRVSPPDVNTRTSALD